MIETTSPFGDLQMSAYFWRVVLDWVPFAVFIGLMIYFMRRAVKAQPDAAKRLNEHRERQIDEMHRININLERIVASLEAQRTTARISEDRSDTHAPP